jgi:hypothetical protein
MKYEYFFICDLIIVEFEENLALNLYIISTYLYNMINFYLIFQQNKKQQMESDNLK